MSTKGYYSLIQYCPDESRAEAANIGVILLCPEYHFLDVRVSSTNERVRRFFGKDKDAYKEDFVQSVKKSIETRLILNPNNIKTVEELTHFAETYTNKIQVTLPRFVRVEDPKDEIENLLTELVLTPENKEKETHRSHSRLGYRLRDVFESPQWYGKILRRQKVTVPVTDSIVEAPYAFQNGQLNLICPVHFNTQTLARAKALATDGNLLQKYNAEARIWIALARPVDITTTQLSDSVTNLFDEYSIPVYHEEKIEELEQAVKEAIH
jgi:hypothetical protein